MAQCGWYGNVRSWQLEPKIFPEGKGKVLIGTINKWEEASPFPVPTSRLPLAPLLVVVSAREAPSKEEMFAKSQPQNHKAYYRKLDLELRQA